MKWSDLTDSQKAAVVIAVVLVILVLFYQFTDLLDCKYEHMLTLKDYEIINRGFNQSNKDYSVLKKISEMEGANINSFE